MDLEELPRLGGTNLGAEVDNRSKGWSQMS